MGVKIKPTDESNLNDSPESHSPKHTFCQLSPESFNLFLKFSQQCILWIFIDLSLVLDILSTVCIPGIKMFKLKINQKRTEHSLNKR